MSRVAIIMGARNCAKYLERTITSIINQTYHDWTLFVVDDASTDETAASLLRMMDLDQRVVPIRSNINLGCDGARNKAIEQMREESNAYDYVAFCDSDDVWLPHHLENAVATLNTTKADMYYCDADFQNSNDEQIVVYGIPRYSSFDRNNLLKQNFIFVSSVVVRANAVEKFDGFCDPKGDWDMWLRISEKGTVVYSPKIGIKYRWKNEGSYYTEDESTDAFHKVQAKHHLIKDDADRLHKLGIMTRLKNEYLDKHDYERSAFARFYEKALSAPFESHVPQPKNKTVVIHPYSHKIPNGKNENPKNYPHWPAVVDRLKKEGIHTIQIGVTGERLIGADEMLFNAPYDRLEDVLEMADTFACVDSFFQHFARYNNRNGVVVFGPSDPEIFGHPENVNLLKSRSVLRPNQFSTWAECEYKPDIFPEPEVVAEAILKQVAIVNHKRTSA